MLNLSVSQRDEVIRQVEDSIEAKRSLQRHADTLILIAGQIAEAFRNGNKVLFFGNGGSAADAQHLAAELSGRFRMDRDPLPALALTVNASALTAIGNDYGFEHVFARQARGLVKTGDVVIGISTSGDSPNVILGIEEAKRQGAVTVALIGQGGRLGDIADHVLSIPSRDTARIQEAHITAGHIISGMVEKDLFGNGVADEAAESRTSW